MNPENKQCQKCHASFTIEPEDFAFYKKMDVPPPTLCPDCRLERRFSWRNERSFHKAVCGICNKNIISTYNPERFPNIFCQSCWYSDKWSANDYAKEYDYSKPFFTQFSELMYRVPVLNMWSFSNENCDYANYTAFSKNVYLSSSVVAGEDVLYSYSVDKSRNCIDCFRADEAENCYECINISKCTNCAYVIDSRECLNSWLLRDCVNCDSCILCVGLRNKKFCVKNKQLSKETFYETVKKLNLGSREAFKNVRQEFTSLQKTIPRKYARIIKSEECTGDDIVYSKNVKKSFLVGHGENLKYCWRMPEYAKDCYDIGGTLKSELIYEGIVVATQNYFSKFLTICKESKYLEYCMLDINCSHLFGCIGLKNKEYCVLNKEYEKSEYESLVLKIKAHMNEILYRDKKGRVYAYGEFFPSEWSPFAYNESVAQEYFPKTETEITEEGYVWSDAEEKKYQDAISPKDLPDQIESVNDQITKETIQCFHEGKCTHHCSGVFRVLERELKTYRIAHIPLPELCPNCRHYERLSQRNPLKLWQRKCDCEGEYSKNKTYKNTGNHAHGNNICPNKFKTPYNPNNSEVVYCEACYQSEIL